ncbi:hypothetical protein SAMN05192564_104394 [Paraburkholderia sartisoli]|uniref:Uncharacterized protein n=1 Tax=Paraburkholderia sartisoli TaxID=83784 RepID=A0A1H4FIF6_9BURK|nr:hypothetical protein SAMN05192564_104394 [Paraburkholderia sartisoli]
MTYRDLSAVNADFRLAEPLTRWPLEAYPSGDLLTIYEAMPKGRLWPH